ncbi:sigma-70 family RNA polymerase sigma factor [Allorhizobium sp. BGMRC 0089]|uniref:sigma-70 family RNA polymerase sigma factor n=1 Tax=Allorhizobium sonneratiae TaxID=2934936 RepID=UPI002034A51A|nr:sigma-70 family RNA polymerase sigma factor [Allorhizobium sonneratiae]MCM2294063.1 sigma-70 family RNA polymerase sigma factor [Allorhizobium sonneratiae]
MGRQQVVELIPALRAFARTFCRNPEDADDLVQETLLRAIAHYDQYSEGTRLKSWLFTIMRYTFSTTYRKREREVVGLAQSMLDSLVSQPEQEWSVRSRDVYEALQRLPVQYREVLVLVVVMGESYEDTAIMCGCAIGTVKSRMNRARQRLKQELGEVDIDIDDDADMPSDDRPSMRNGSDAVHLLGR